MRAGRIRLALINLTSKRENQWCSSPYTKHIFSHFFLPDILLITIWKKLHPFPNNCCTFVR